jgi:hypothetical protein
MDAFHGIMLVISGILFAGFVIFMVFSDVDKATLEKAESMMDDIEAQKSRSCCSEEEYQLRKLLSNMYQNANSELRCVMKQVVQDNTDVMTGVLDQIVHLHSRIQSCNNTILLDVQVDNSIKTLNADEMNILQNIFCDHMSTIHGIYDAISFIRQHITETNPGTIHPDDPTYVHGVSRTYVDKDGKNVYPEDVFPLHLAAKDRDMLMQALDEHGIATIRMKNIILDVEKDARVANAVELFILNMEPMMRLLAQGEGNPIVNHVYYSKEEERFFRFTDGDQRVQVRASSLLDLISPNVKMAPHLISYDDHLGHAHSVYNHYVESCRILKIKPMWVRFDTLDKINELKTNSARARLAVEAMEFLGALLAGYMNGGAKADLIKPIDSTVIANRAPFCLSNKCTYLPQFSHSDILAIKPNFPNAWVGILALGLSSILTYRYSFLILKDIEKFMAENPGRSHEDAYRHAFHKYIQHGGAMLPVNNLLLGGHAAVMHANEMHCGGANHPMGSARMHWFWDSVPDRSNPTVTIVPSSLADQEGHVYYISENMVCPRTTLHAFAKETYTDTYMLVGETESESEEEFSEPDDMMDADYDGCV